MITFGHTNIISGSKNGVVQVTCEENNLTTPRSGTITIQKNDNSSLKKIVYINQEAGASKNYIGGFNGITINDDWWLGVTGGDPTFDPDTNKQFSMSFESNRDIPISGTVTFICTLPQAVLSLGPLTAKIAPYVDSVTTDVYVDATNMDGSPIDWDNFEGEMICTFSISYDFTNVDFYVGKEIIDFGIEIICSDYNTYTLGYLTSMNQTLV